VEETASISVIDAALSKSHAALDPCVDGIIYSIFQRFNPDWKNQSPLIYAGTDITTTRQIEA